MKLAGWLDRALDCGRLMVAVWRVEPGEGENTVTLSLDCQRLDFPTDQMPEAIRLLRDQLSADVRRVAQDVIAVKTRTPEPRGTP